MGNLKACAKCGEIVSLTALGCPKCGQPFPLDVRGEMIFPSDKSPRRAFFLSFALMAGFGQFYVGQFMKGVLWLAISVLAGLPTLGLGTLVVNFISAYDAYRVADKLSRGQPAGTWDWFPR